MKVLVVELEGRNELYWNDIEEILGDDVLTEKYTNETFYTQIYDKLSEETIKSIVKKLKKLKVGFGVYVYETKGTPIFSLEYEVRA